MVLAKKEWWRKGEQWSTSAEEPSGSRKTEAGSWARPTHQWEGLRAQSSGPRGDEVQDWYHGCHVSSALSILQSGFKPGFGTGSDNLLRHYGVPVPGVYLASSWQRASGYPMNCTAQLRRTGNTRKGWRQAPGGTLVATDGTMPIRVVFRCLIRKQSWLWKRTDSSQLLALPEGIFITHMTIYAVKPELAHQQQLVEAPSVEVERLNPIWPELLSAQAPAPEEIERLNQVARVESTLEDERHTPIAQIISSTV